MPSSPSTRLLLELQAAGENLNTWGAPKLNAALSMLDKAIRGRAAITVSGTQSLSGTNYTSTDDTAAWWDLSGTGGTLTIPSRERVAFVRNGCSAAVTVTTGSGTSAVIGSSEVTLIICDATNVYQLGVGGDSFKDYVDEQAFEALNGDLPAQTGNDGLPLVTDGTNADWQAIAISAVTGLQDALDLLAPLASPALTGDPTFAAGFSLTGSARQNVIELSGTEIDVADAELFTDSISTNTTYTFTGATASKGMAFALLLTISSAAVPTFPATVLWTGGSDPSPGNGTHLFGFVTFNGGTSWVGSLVASAVS